MSGLTAASPADRGDAHHHQADGAEDQRCAPGSRSRCRRVLSSERAELALNTITAPKASRQRVAVSSSEYSSGGAAGLRPPLAVGCRAPLRARSSQRLDQLAEAVAALLEVLEGVEAGAGRGEQDDLAGLGVRRGRVDGALERRRSAEISTPASAAGASASASALGGLADQVAGDAALGAPARRAARSSPPSRARRGSARTPPSKALIPASAEATLVAFESLT